MFCPQCSAENGPAQSYCRHCGLTLSTVRLAMEGRVEEALTKLKRGQSALRKGIIIFSLFLLATVIAILRSGPFEIAIWPLVFRITDWWIALLSSFLFGVPVILLGLARLRQAHRLLDAQDRGDGQAVEGADGADALPPAALTSIVEDKTLELKLSERMPRR